MNQYIEQTFRCASRRRPAGQRAVVRPVRNRRHCATGTARVHAPSHCRPVTPGHRDGQQCCLRVRRYRLMHRGRRNRSARPGATGARVAGWPGKRCARIGPGFWSRRRPAGLVGAGPGAHAGLAGSLNAGATDASPRARQIRESRHICISAIVLCLPRHPVRSPALLARLFGEWYELRLPWGVTRRCLPGGMSPLDRSLTRRCYRAGWGAVSGDQAELPGPRDGLGAVGGAELAQDMGHVLFDRVERHHQVIGDALV